jgi:hypothetical protein
LCGNIFIQVGRLDAIGDMILSGTFNVNVVSVFKLVGSIKGTRLRRFGLGRPRSVAGLFDFMQLDVVGLWNGAFLNLNGRLGAVRDIALSRAIGMEPASVFRLTGLFQEVGLLRFGLSRPRGSIR